ncbi:pseudouridylate synthase [Acidianus sulfidivorans JP7]|uniref:pseudouridylate synthase n=1 Tax=Acidianus sulfidivorans TaxID=312539 RepID=UPI001442F13E|nr:pseudouridylate synthase [Acidianus sulfidivorans]QIJ32898.1 pseudouridylate synthase [Acidianus sulfidivorans JP7]
MKNSSVSSLDKAYELLKKYPLCDSCLGRCFAKLGYKLTNKERGKALKISLILDIDTKIKDHELEDISQIKEILYNIGKEYSGIYEIYFTSEEFQQRTCYLCNSQIEEIEEDFYNKALSLLNKLKKENNQKDIKYVLGVKLSDHMKELEKNFVFQNGLIYYESIRNEIKREVGKKLTSSGYPPSIDDADIEIVYDMDTRNIYTISKKYKTLYYYNRLSRKVTISSWYSDNSLEKSLNTQIMIPFTEPSEIRILDDYPIILENDEPNIEAKGYFMKKIRTITRKEISFIMSIKPTNRTYRILYYSNSDKKNTNAKEIYKNIYQITINAKNFEELKNKLYDIEGEIISIDLISSEGKHKNLETKLNL